ncbi:MAG TPA: PAS domain-containing protein [Chloroflexia bacterium]|nr:PAS domain-containing protein [Chloroflexia bacterium]
MKTIFAPAAALMSRLKFTQRFSLITVLFLLPLGIALFMLMSRINTDVNFTQKELKGTSYLRAADALMRHTINDWILGLDAVRGLDVNDAALVQNTIAIDADFGVLQSLDGQYGAALHTTQPLALLAAQWNKIKAMPHTVQRQILYRPLVQDIATLIATVGDQSNLVLDSQLDTHYTMQAILVSLPQAQSEIADIGIIGNGVVGARKMFDDQQATLNALATQLLSVYDGLARDAKVAYANNPTGNLQPNVDVLAGAASTSASALVDKLLTGIVQAPLINMSLDTWMAPVHSALDTNYNLWDAQVTQLDALLNARNSADEGTRTLALGLTAAVLLLVIYMWVGFHMAVMKTVKGLEEASLLMATGVSASPELLQSYSRDELGMGVAATISKMASATTQMNSTIQARTSELTEVSILLAYMHEGIIITEADGMIKVLNPAAVRILGTGFDNAVGHSLYTFILDPRFRETMHSALEAPRQRHIVDVALMNRIVSVSITFAPINEGTYEGMLVLQDTTELRTLQHLQKAHSGAERV